MKYITTIDEHEFAIEILEGGRLTLNGDAYQVDFDSVDGQPVFSLLLNGRSYEAYVYHNDEGLQVLLHGSLYVAQVEDEREKRLRAAAGGSVVEKGEFHLKAPMPGLVVAVPVGEGSQVTKGDVLVVLESMKMQNELKAPRDGTVARLRVHAGDSVEQKQTLLSVI